MVKNQFVEKAKCDFLCRYAMHTMSKNRCQQSPACLNSLLCIHVYVRVLENNHFENEFEGRLFIFINLPELPAVL
jgi:hypothetical protein